MKKIVLIAFILFGGYFAADVKASNDTVQALKEKIEKMEKTVNQLQSELKALRSTDSSLSADLQAIKKTAPAARTRKLVIDRRGTKQAYLQ